MYRNKLHQENKSRELITLHVDAFD